MRKIVAPVLCVALMLGGAVMVGCKASAQVGTTEPKPAPPPPPPAPKKEEPKKEEPKKEEHKPKLSMKFKMKGDQLELPGPVVFETGSDKLRPESDEVLNIVDKYMKDESSKDVTLLRVEGHTDSDGDNNANQTLSEKRAMTVARWLVAKGNDCHRLIAVGFGETKPIADNATPEGKAQNRRTSFVNAAMKGKPIGNFPVDGGGKNAGDPCK